MKKLRLMAIVAMLSVCVNSFAQFTNGSSSASSANTEGWKSVWVQYNPSKLEDTSFNGISLGYSEAFSLSQTTPLFIEAGAGLQYSFYSEDIDYGGYEMTSKFNMFSLKIPVNLTYKFDLADGKVALCPFAGVSLRFNVSGKMKVEEDGEELYDLNVFDKEDMGSKDATFKRFQIGWQIGLNAHFGSSFLVGASYGTDFSEICKNTKIKTASLTVGYKF